MNLFHLIIKASSLMDTNTYFYMSYDINIHICMYMCVCMCLSLPYTVDISNSLFLHFLISPKAATIAISQSRVKYDNSVDSRSLSLWAER